jgi:hypothetical protein
MTTDTSLNPDPAEETTPDSSRQTSARSLLNSALRSRRTGKVARLPLATRDKLNHLLADGLSYADILQTLGPEAAHLTPQNLSTWAQGGYQEWLDLQDKHLLTESVCHHIDHLDKPEDPDLLFERVLRITAAHIVCTMASLPAPNPEAPDFTWTRLLKEIPRLTKAVIDFRFFRHGTSPEALQKEKEQVAKRRANLLNAVRYCGYGELCEALQGSIKVNEDGTWYRPDPNNPDAPPRPEDIRGYEEIYGQDYEAEEYAPEEEYPNPENTTDPAILSYAHHPIHTHDPVDPIYPMPPPVTRRGELREPVQSGQVSPLRDPASSTSEPAPSIEEPSEIQLNQTNSNVRHEVITIKA